MVAVSDGKGKDIEFNSPYMVAVAEAEGINLNKYKADLNVTIPLATYKRTDIDINDANVKGERRKVREGILSLQINCSARN